LRRHRFQDLCAASRWAVETISRFWTADGPRIAYQSEEGGDAAIYWQRADGSGTAERLMKPAEGGTHLPNSWSPKGDAFLFTIVKKSIASLWVFSMSDRSRR
jgi:Tol biopolymer transport system component